MRIQAKRRPQSRHARKSALRHSGIDFDTVDNADDSQEESHTSTFSHTSSKESAVPPAATDRLSVSDNAQRDPGTDDKSELGSVSKESSMSVNKNTLLSPSTDEEDLFDVPPDLPEDPQKEDTLFGRAPILSPVGSELSEKTPVAAESLVDSVIRNVGASTISATSDKSDREQDPSEITRSDQVDSKLDMSKRQDEKRAKEADGELDDKTQGGSGEEPSDPLRDSSHDPLKNPSQLFAFVTKTPSPDKGKGLLFSEDDSLFSSGAKKPSDERPQKKEVLDLFADDVGGDLFAAPLKRTVVKKPLRDTKISLFDDDDDERNEDDSLFGSASVKTRLDAQKSSAPVQAGRKKNNIFDDEDDDDSSLFVESSGHSQKSDSASISESRHDFVDAAKSSNLKNIFGNDAACGDDDDDVDIFATKRVVPKKVAPSKSLFASDDDDDDGHIFGKPSAPPTGSKPKTVIASSRPAVKKPITRDLKKTAEKIVEDPLSLLQDD